MINPKHHMLTSAGVVRARQKQEEPEPPKVIRADFAPQDPLVGIIDEVAIPADYAKNGQLSSPRVVIDDNGPIAQPDENGNMKYPHTDKRFTQVEVLVASQETIDMWERYAGHRIDWAFGSEQLTGHPDAGEDFNAYYARWEGGHYFFHAFDDRYPCRETAGAIGGPAARVAMHAARLAAARGDDCGKMIYSGQSNEVASHETGHAALDGWKPNYLSWGTDSAGHHESFGDYSGILRTLFSDAVIDRMLQETNGDIRQSNLVTRLGEELSRGIADVILRLPPEEAAKWIMRDAANKLEWSDPADLPWNPRDPNQLGSEPHNYSRLFTGTFWDLLSGMYERNVAAGDDRKTAVVKARDEAGTLMAKMLDFAPDSLDAYRQLGKAMLVADAKSMEGRNHDLIAAVLIKRKILTEDDVKQVGAALANVPKVKLPEAYRGIEGANETTLAAMQQVLFENHRALGLDAANLPAPVKVIRTKSGETFFHYQWTEEAQLKGSQFKQYNGAFIDVHGSLLLAFNAEGELAHVENTPVTPERVAEAKGYVRRLINEGMVKYTRPFQTLATRDFFKSDGQPYAAYTTYRDSGTKMRVEPVPIFT